MIAVTLSMLSNLGDETSAAFRRFPDLFQRVGVRVHLNSVLELREPWLDVAVDLQIAAQIERRVQPGLETVVVQIAEVRLVLPADGQARAKGRQEQLDRIDVLILAAQRHRLVRLHRERACSRHGRGAPCHCFTVSKLPCPSAGFSETCARMPLNVSISSDLPVPATIPSIPVVKR